MLDLAEELKKRVFGWDDIIDAVVPFVMMYETQLHKPGRPPGVFLISGTTGIGKTFFVSQLADILHRNPRCYLHISGGEFQLGHEVSKLVGAPPGYLGHKETPPMLGQDRLISSDYSKLSIVLIDEIEKAADEFYRILLNIFDSAFIQLGNGLSTKFDDTMFFMTSNLGAKGINRIMNPYGFNQALPPDTPVTATSNSYQSATSNAAKRYFAPEFLNRITLHLTAKPLELSVVKKILRVELNELGDRLVKAHNIGLAITKDAVEFLVVKGYDKDLGARPVSRLVDKEITQQVVKLILQGAFNSRIETKMMACVDIEGDKVVVKSALLEHLDQKYIEDNV